MPLSFPFLLAVSCPWVGPTSQSVTNRSKRSRQPPPPRLGRRVQGRRVLAAASLTPMCRRCMPPSATLSDAQPSPRPSCQRQASSLCKSALPTCCILKSSCGARWQWDPRRGSCHPRRLLKPQPRQTIRGRPGLTDRCELCMRRNGRHAMPHWIGRRTCACHRPSSSRVPIMVSLSARAARRLRLELRRSPISRHRSRRHGPHRTRRRTRSFTAGPSGVPPAQLDSGRHPKASSLEPPSGASSIDRMVPLELDDAARWTMLRGPITFTE